mmetsp:Transcript_16804/g.42062  ORF Transcript_16804/g.42062 Transcript_16804/m.42062 type:complete len:205 (-) Transcript_16804:3758-4372(-)
MAPEEPPCTRASPCSACPCCCCNSICACCAAPMACPHLTTCACCPLLPAPPGPRWLACWLWPVLRAVPCGCMVMPAAAEGVARPDGVCRPLLWLWRPPRDTWCRMPAASADAEGGGAVAEDAVTRPICGGEGEVTLPAAPALPPPTPSDACCFFCSCDMHMIEEVGCMPGCGCGDVAPARPVGDAAPPSPAPGTAMPMARGGGM